MTPDVYWLPIIFIGLTGLAVLVYALLDGYDLGVGLLVPFAKNDDRDTMIASIGPFWDANETWLVLAVGLILIAFPEAHSAILTSLYLPAFVLLLGLILRGVAFDFRAKARASHKGRWDRVFASGSLLATLAQGYMLGRYVTAFDASLLAYAFALLSALCVTAAYALNGASWLIMKTEGELQQYAAVAAKWSGVLALIGIASVSLVNPLMNATVWDKWLALPAVFLLMLIPLGVAVLFTVLFTYLRHFPHGNDVGSWVPFAATAGIFVLSFLALGYSYFPDIIPGQLTIWEAASAPESLLFILVGVAIVLPAIIIYTLYMYWVFRGKAGVLDYD